MSSLLRGVLVALLLLTALPPVAPATQIALAQGPTDGLVPLPGGCGGGLPPDEQGAACCMYGYVIVDGRPVTGARVTITGPGPSVITRWTNVGRSGDEPTYGTSLLDVAQPGDTVTITVEYAGRVTVVTHQVLPDGQQVDVVFPRQVVGEAAFAEELRPLGENGAFTQPEGVAVDSAGERYVVDTAGNRVVVFDADGVFLRSIGTIGGPEERIGRSRGIAISPSGEIFVSDTNNHRVTVFGRSGFLKRSIGSYGIGEGQFIEPAGLALDAEGRLYVVERATHRVQVLDSLSGEHIATWGGPSGGSGDKQFQYPYGIAVAGEFVYVTDTNNSRVQKFRRDGTFLKAWGSADPGDDQLGAPTGIAVAANGEVFVSESSYGRIKVFDADGVYLRQIVAPAEVGSLLNPIGLAIALDGNLQVADSGNNRVLTFTPGGQLVEPAFERPTSTPSLGTSYSIALGADGTIFVADTHMGQIRVFDQQGNQRGMLGQRGTGDGELAGPYGVAVGDDNLIYVADTANHRIQVFDRAGNNLHKWGSLGTGDGQFRRPAGIAVHGDEVYVSEIAGHRIQVFDRQGNYLRQWGSFGTGDTQFDGPFDLAIASDGTVYVVDTANWRIRRFTPTGAPLGGWNTGNGEAIRYPYGIALDQAGHVYVAATSNNRVEVYSASGTFLWQTGNQGTGPGQYSGPIDVAVDSDGRVVVLDQNNFRVQELRPITNERPIATIVATSAYTLTAGQSIDFFGRGSVSVEGASISGYAWSLDGATTPVATSAQGTLDTAGLKPGLHTLSLNVTDSGGRVSAARELTFEILKVPGGDKTWTFLLYLDGDNDRTTAPLLRAIKDLKDGPISQHVRIFALFDGDGDGDSVRYSFAPDAPWSEEPVGEVNMGDPQTLIDFVAWARSREPAPADAYYLSIADHGDSLAGIAKDVHTGTAAATDILDNREIRRALVAITQNGRRPIDVLHFDACLLGLIENAYQVRGLASYVIASENLAWSVFGYYSYQQAVEAQTTPEQLARAIVDAYAVPLAKPERPYPYTLSVLDLSATQETALAMRTLSAELLRYSLASEDNRIALRRARGGAQQGGAQQLDSTGDERIDAADAYIDLDHWLELLILRATDEPVKLAADKVRQSLKRLVIYQRAGSGTTTYNNSMSLEDARGLGIYYPSRPNAIAYQQYERTGLAFSPDTGWGAFLTGGLSAQLFDANALAPQPVAPLMLGTRLYLAFIRR